MASGIASVTRGVVAWQRDLRATLREGAIRGFEDAYHLQAVAPVAEDRPTLQDGIEEVAALGGERLGPVDVGADDLSVAIRELEFAERRGVRRRIHAAIE